MMRGFMNTPELPNTGRKKQSRHATKTGGNHSGAPAGRGDATSTTTKVRSALPATGRHSEQSEHIKLGNHHFKPPPCPCSSLGLAAAGSMSASNASSSMGTDFQELALGIWEFDLLEYTKYSRRLVLL
ncbi:hypothetical protein AK812_SmicGene30103 [Symbiodinium microadriaticum]|uniref:Uncharacterized protein n=1 Tax=Symbiodinium microadriaticum TaxID=2951 RepID=A0A1Q9D049_SYMMI|nr:hypothetical protein AK812_SmicGene30103 [Symbiodinium microadriaticum]